MLRSLVITVGTLAAFSAGGQYLTVDFSSQFNFSRTDNVLSNGYTFPAGNQTYQNVPFHVGSGPNGSDPWGWTAHWAVSSGPAKLTIPTNIPGALEVYSLLNTSWGQPGPGSLASITFNATNGLSHTVLLVGNSDIRDYNDYIYTNLINNTTTREVFNNNLGQRLDMQTYTLPQAFALETLTSIVLDDIGANGVQRIFAAGITVKALPAPGAAAVCLLSGLSCAGRRRR